MNTDSKQIDRRRFLTLTAASASSLALATSPTTVEAQDATDVDGFSCEHPQFRCGQEVTAAGGMVSTVDSRAAEVAASVLRDGGTAFDAAAALQYTLNVTQPHGSGIGGGGFTIVHDAESGTTEAIDSRERASKDATPDLYLTEGEYDQNIQTGEAMGTPGTMMAAETLRKEYGTMSRQRLIDPAIKLARNGFTVDWFLAEQIRGNESKLNDAALETYSDDAGDLYEAGDTMTNPDLADTFEIIKREGSEGFYEGPVAADLAATISEYARNPDQVVDEEDLADYDVKISEPVRKDWYDVELVGQPMPSSGPTVIEMMLRMLEFLNIEEHNVRSAEKYHLFAESMYSCWADRMEYMGDDEFADVPVDELLSDEYLQARANQIEFGDTVFPDDSNTMYPGDPLDASPDPRMSDSNERLFDPATAIGNTTHFTTADRFGNAVSWTSTIERFMGSGKMVPGRGFMINNELTDFDAAPGGPNQPNGWKRPLSSTSPMMVLRDGEPEFTAGSPGGWSIPDATLQTILHRYVYDQSPLESVTEPRLYTHSFGGVSWSEGVPAGPRETLESWGHSLDDNPGPIGNVQVIAVGDDELTGAADPNRAGQAIGYTGGTADGEGSDGDDGEGSDGDDGEGSDGDNGEGSDGDDGESDGGTTADGTPGFGPIVGTAAVSSAAYLYGKYGANDDDEPVED